MISEIFSVDSLLWSCVWQSTIFLVVGLIGSFFLRHRSSRAHQVLFLAMIAAVVVPVITTLVHHYKLGIFVAKPDVIERSVGHMVPMGVDHKGEAVTPQDGDHNAHQIEHNSPISAVKQRAVELPWYTVTLWAWIIVSFILAIRLVLTFLMGVRLLNRAGPLDSARIQEALGLAKTRLAIAKDLTILCSEHVRSPVIWCWKRKPVLLVPNNTEQSNVCVDWAGVLCHELAHFRRRDHISGLLAELAVCVLPWHPLLWWAKSRLINLSEQTCDDWVLASGQPCTDYAESLLDLTPGGQMAFVPAVVNTKKGLAGRIHRILKDRCGNPRTGLAWALTVSIVTICLAVGVAFAQTRPVEPANAEVQDKAAATAALFRAIRDTNIERMRLAIDQGADLEGKNKDEIFLIDNVQSIGCTPLYVAAGVPEGNVDMIGLLVKAGANPNTRAPNGEIALHEAARGWDISMVEMLVSAGSDVNAADKEGRTPAMIAFELGHHDMFDLMVAHGATVSTELMAAYKGDLSRVQSLIENGKAQERFGQGLTLLHAAAAGGHTAIVDLLLTNGLDVRSQTQRGYTALHYAAAGNHREVAELLLAKGADVNAEPGDQTPLHWAVRERHKDMINWLLARGANPNADAFGTPLHWAVWWWDVDTALLLVSHGADIHLYTQSYPFSPLFDSVKGGDRAMVEALVTKTGDTKAAQWAPLHAAASSGNMQAIENLLARGADVNAKSDRGLSALHSAAVFGHKDIVELLIEKGADVNAKAEHSMWDEGMTALHGSCVKGQKGVAELLIAKGADVNAKSKKGYTPLHVAVTQGYRDVVELLIAKGADINAKDNKERTVFSLAKKKGYNEIIELLRKHGAKE
jgi:ankyrin repeat protein/beta-lactamase regulating signal transducer with metallopeptidase domain